jgi:hypothetical protein
MKKNYFSKDTIDLIRLFMKHKVKYVIVGGEAVIFYGYARLTGDIDFFYEISESNSTKLYNALKEFWSGDIPGISTPNDFRVPGMIIQFGQPPNRIDLINIANGITFIEAWDSRVIQTIGEGNSAVKVYYIGLEPLIKNKTATGRYKDLDDLRFLSKVNMQQ